ncbi:DNA repair protein RAD51 homolog 2 isoform X1 [Malus domestica]|uniref:DNA repair protein RAD51 homolog 2 isoform X1 n=1 Tax=Malus domestica TaxID=3750 RepID=UPI003974F324
MANKLINQMGLPKSIANVFTARNITTAKEALSLTEFELMEVLDVNLAEVTSAIARISEITCPPYQTVLSLMEQQVQKEHNGGHLSTRLKGLDDALCGGIPFGVLTELVGPAGIGKTQFCLKLALLASLPEAYGGLDGRVIYIDVESKFSSRRMIEIGSKSFPEIFHKKGMAQEMAGRILVMRPTSLSEFTESLQQLKISLLQNQVKLLIIDSMAALVAGEQGQGAPRQHLLGWHISFIKSLAEFSRIPIVVTNQVRSQIHDEACQYAFQGRIVWSNCEILHMNYECNISYSAVQHREKALHEHTEYDSHLVAALGIHWAHAVTIRLVLDSKSGKRFIKLAKSPISPPLAFAFNITSSGISLLSDGGIELTGPEINTIHCQGHSDIINFDGKRFQ